jgi:hypothetical protein
VKKYISTIVCGFGAGVLQVVPLIKSFSCCLIIPTAAFLALTLDMRAANSKEKIKMSKGFLFGLLTGVFAAAFGSFFEILITFITKQNDIIASFPQLQTMLQGFPVDPQIKNDVINIFESVRKELATYGFSWFYTITLLISNFLVNSVFGAVGGLIGAQIINSRLRNTLER